MVKPIPKDPSNPVEVAALESCAEVLDSFDKTIPRQQLEAAIVIAFALGASWAAGEMDLIDKGRAMIRRQQRQWNKLKS